MSSRACPGGYKIYCEPLDTTPIFLYVASVAEVNTSEVFIVGYADREREFASLYVVEGLSTREIARRFGCSRSTVSYWVRSFLYKVTNEFYDPAGNAIDFPGLDSVPYFINLRDFCGRPDLEYLFSEKVADYAIKRECIEYTYYERYHISDDEWVEHLCNIGRFGWRLVWQERSPYKDQYRFLAYFQRRT